MKNLNCYILHYFLKFTRCGINHIRQLTTLAQDNNVPLMPLCLINSNDAELTQAKLSFMLVAFLTSEIYLAVVELNTFPLFHMI
jgi:hypothetical protein